MSQLIMCQQFSRFLFVGGLATLVQYAILWLGVDIFLWPAFVASGLGYLIGSVVSYFANYFFTFDCKESHVRASARFYIMVLVGWGINTTIMAMLVDILELNKWGAQIIATIFTLAWNFLASRTWVFRKVQRE